MNTVHTFFLTGALLLQVLLLSGQPITVLSTSATSGIEYASEDGPIQRVFAGQNLRAEGRLKISAGRSVNVVYEGRKIHLEGPKEVDIAEMVSVTNTAQGGGFISRFWDFISSAVTNTSSAEDVENYHRKYMTNTRAGIKGWGNKENSIAFAGYFSEVFGVSELPLQWDSIANIHQYQVSIIDRSTDEIVLTAMTRTNQISIPLADLALSPEAIYQLRITADKDGETITAPETFFSYEPEAVTTFLENLQQKRIFKALTADEQLLFVPHALEEAGYLYSARQHYIDLVAADASNQLYKKVYASFLARMNAPEEAKTIIK